MVWLERLQQMDAPMRRIKEVTAILVSENQRGIYSSYFPHHMAIFLRFFLKYYRGATFYFCHE